MSGPACASCGSANEADARFCESCGSPLQRTCGACGAAASATARFCRACGTSLDDPRPQVVSTPIRKTVTVLFADLAGSTAFEELVDPETAREVIGQYHELLRAIAERHRAGMTKYIGDGFMAVWGVPEIGAGDAEHAVDAAVELQERFVDLAGKLATIHGVELALRVAVNTGEVVVGTDDADLVGDALNVGARLESECPHGHVVVGEQTWRSTRGRHRYDPRGAVRVKGRSAAVPVYQWVARRTETSDSVPFVGRDAELQRMRAIFDEAVAAAGARLVTVIGDPGVGKTRLAAEFTGALGEGVQVLRARCAVEGSPAMTPLVDVLRTRDLESDIAVTVAERDRILRDLTGMTAGVAGSVEEAFWALRRYVEVLAMTGPLVLVVDDIQWADTLLLDFIEHLVEWVRGAPVLLVALARPELRESRPDLLTVGGWVADALPLRGLAADATAELAARVLGSDLPNELLIRLPSSTGGNPLFVRELIGMLVHDGVLVAKPGGWNLTVDVDTIAVPPTIQALLASRLERLDTGNRRVLEVASVIGTDFSPSAVAALAGVGRTEIMSALNRLRRLDLAQPSGVYAGDEPVWRFHHVLIRDVAYGRLLKSERAELHERLANWVHAGGASAAFEADEVIARNLEAAHGYRCDLGLRDGQTGELALRSARNYLASARRALDRDELGSAGGQAARGAALAGADPALHAELLLVGSEAYLSAGDVAAGAGLVDDLERVAGGDLAPWVTCYRCQLVAYTDPTRLLEVDARLQEAIDEFSRRKDAAGLAKAHRVRANARARLGRVGDCETDLFDALIAARQGGDHRQITAALGAAPTAALWGPSPAPKAGGRCLDVVRMQRMTTAAPSLEATSLRCLAVLELLRGRPDKARSMLADARKVVADLGLRHGLMETELFAGLIELMVGDAVAAEPHFRIALEGLDSLGVGADAGQAAALLARSVLAQGRLEEADKYARESERIAGHNLKTAIAWRSVRAEILAAQGRHGDAAAMARDAVAVAADTDLVLDHADACLALSRVLESAGDDHGATLARREAHALYAAKDAVFLAGPVAARSVSEDRRDVEVPRRASRLVVANRASAVGDRQIEAMQRHDIDGTLAFWGDPFVYNDRRRLSGDPIEGRAALRMGIQRICEQYTNFEVRTLAVRGDNVYLAWTRWTDDDGNETRYVGVYELDADGLIIYHSRFDDEDFWAAYRDLEDRYYAGEGARFAVHGLASADWVIGISQGDIEGVRRVSHPEFRWVAQPSALKDRERTVDDMFAWMRMRAHQVSSQRHWVSALKWLSPTCSVGLGEIEATGADGEDYRWNFLFVGICRDGRLLSLREFDVTDEDAAFAYAESLVASGNSRLPASNAASRALDRVIDAFQANDPNAVTDLFSTDIVYEDRRSVAGGLVTGIDYLRESVPAMLAQYNHFEGHSVAIRGDRVCLGWSHWWDDPGNEVVNLHVGVLGEDGLVTSLLYFDGDDFDSAYRELERRYYAGEGAPYADVGAPLTELVLSENRGDLDRTFEMYMSPGLQIESRSRSIFPRRTREELRRSVEELGAMVESYRVWASASCWVSSDVMVARHEREAIGRGGEKYTWTRLYVGQVTDGLFTTLCEFDVDDEEAAFAYAEELSQGRSRRLPLDNPATATTRKLGAALQSGRIDDVLEFWSDDVVLDDRRHYRGDPVSGKNEFRAATEVVLNQFNNFEIRTVAVRGESLALAWSRWADDAGNESQHVHVIEVDSHGRIAVDVRFDPDDFNSACRELDHRYYTGEGAAYAAAGATLAEIMTAASPDDLDWVFGELMAPNLRVESRSRTIYPRRTPAQLRASIEEFLAATSSLRSWVSAVCWLSPTCVVGRQERESVGPEGERYEWTRIYVGEFEGGIVTSLCDFDVEFEAQAFEYAEQLSRTAASRLAVDNRAAAAGKGLLRATKAGDLDTLMTLYADEFVYDDRRRISGDPIVGRAALGAAFERLHAQYNHFALRILAVRGDGLYLGQTTWADENGNQSISLGVGVIDDDGRALYHGVFDEDDFASAYGELERRYYAGEGAQAARSGLRTADYVAAMNRGDFDTMFADLSWPDLHIENRSRSAFPDRSATDLKASFVELHNMLASVRAWFSAMRWLSPDVFVGRLDRDGRGHDGERYEWTRILVGAFRDGRLARLCEFDTDDEDPAFAYAEGLVSAEAGRLPLTNRASEVASNVVRAMRNRDVVTAVDGYSDSYVFDDRRRWSGDPLSGKVALHAVIERILHQFSSFEHRIMAVRGENVALTWSSWLDDSGNQTAFYHVYEIGTDGLVARDTCFDDDDFDQAYHHFEKAYYRAEGAAFAENADLNAAYVLAMNRGDFDTMFTKLTSPDMRVENHSRSGFPDRSADDLRASLEELYGMLASVRSWFSALRWLSPELVVARLEREGAGRDGERYAWARILVAQYRDGRITSIGEFDADDDAAAFAYAEWLAE